MKYNNFQDIKLSNLGFGCMRLPLKSDQSIDEELTEKMFAIAIENGVNYFDTAYPYHGGNSELVVGKILKKYPRDSFYLATKYPGHQIASTYNPQEIFEDQLKKCQVDYFDFYLLHNVTESSIPVYEDEKWGIIDYFVEQRRLGRIKHLGFSSHARVENLEAFLDRHPGVFEFCQIQLNYLDWTLQNAKEKVDVLNAHNIPIWVMEPCRGGKLANISNLLAEKLKDARPQESIASWCFRYLQQVKGVTMILSGMSNLPQVEDNLKTFSNDLPLNEKELELLADIADKLKDAVPCTGCRYCCDGCPMGLDIPMLIANYNDMKFSGGFTIPMQMDTIDKQFWPNSCIGCGQCMEICPQHIEVPSVLEKFATLLEEGPNWQKICKEREEAAKALKK